MNELLFVWVAILIQSHNATPEQISTLQHTWQPACVEQGGELKMVGSPRIWNGEEAFLIEGQCHASESSAAVPAKHSA